MLKRKANWRIICLYFSVFVLAFSVSLGSVYNLYFHRENKAVEKLTLISEKYSHRNAFFEGCSYIGCRDTSNSYYYYSFYYYPHVLNIGYMPIEALDMYKLQYYINGYEYMYGVEISISTIEDYFSQTKDIESLLSDTICNDSEMNSFLDYVTNWSINVSQMDLNGYYSDGSYLCLLDNKCQEMYGVRLFDMMESGEDDSSKIGNYNLVGYVLTMDQMNAAARAVLADK